MRPSWAPGYYTVDYIVGEPAVPIWFVLVAPTLGLVGVAVLAWRTRQTAVDGRVWPLVLLGAAIVPVAGLLIAAAGREHDLPRQRTVGCLVEAPSGA